MTDTAQRNILCIEDEAFIGELYERALVKAGYKITLVADGKAGLEAALTDEYDIILLDIMVPQLLGIDILHELRAKKPDLKAKVIIATNRQHSDETRAEIEKEADGYFIKADITPHELVEFVNTVR